MVARHRRTVNVAKVFLGSFDSTDIAVFSQHAGNLVILQEPAHSMLKY